MSFEILSQSETRKRREVFYLSLPWTLYWLSISRASRHREELSPGATLGVETGAQWGMAVVTSDCAESCIRLWIWPEQVS